MGTDRRLIDQLVEAMFQFDARGRLSGDAPLLHIVRTPDDLSCCHCREDLPEAVAAELQELAAAPRGRPAAWAGDYARYLSVVARVATVTSIRAGPLYRFPEILPQADGCVVLSPANQELLRGSLDEWIEDVAGGALVVAALVDGRAAAVCASVRASPMAHCAGVETAAAYRGRGLAQFAVVAWARLVRERGAEPFYATTFDNIASQKVAGRLQLEPFGSEFSIYGGVASRTA